MMDSWLLLDSGKCDYAFNMALDEALLEGSALLRLDGVSPCPVLRFYGWTQPAASFGYFQHIAHIEAVTHLRPLVRRPTGGGLVPHDADWTYSVAVPPSHPWYKLRASESYRRIHQWICDAFAALGVPTELAPSSRKELPGQCFVGHEQYDLLWFGRKIAGAAQRRTKAGLLIQGSVQPPPPGIARADWQRAMCEIAAKKDSVEWNEWSVPSSLQQRADALREEKYVRDSYNRRR